MSVNDHEHPHESTAHEPEATEGEFADPSDFSVSRDGDGEILPQTVPTRLGKVQVIPMSYGDVEQYFTSGSQTISAEAIAELIENHVVRPDLAADAGGHITASYVENMKPLAPRELIFAILDASGIDADVEMQDSGGAQVDLPGN